MTAVTGVTIHGQSVYRFGRILTGYVWFTVTDTAKNAVNTKLLTLPVSVSGQKIVANSATSNKTGILRSEGSSIYVDNNYALGAETNGYIFNFTFRTSS